MTTLESLAKLPGLAAASFEERLPRVLVVAPGPKVRGGLTSVVLAHQTTATWEQFRCDWLNTYDDRSAIQKLIAALRAYVVAPASIWRADMVHIHLAADASVIRKLPIVWLVALMGRRVILHFHAAGTESLFAHTPQWALDALRSRADLVITLSPYWKAEFERNWPNVPSVVLPNPVSCSVAKTKKKPGTILFLGKLESRKGFSLIVRALPAILREFPQAQLWMAGHGEVEQGKALARELGVDSSVKFLGWVSGADKQRLLGEAEVLCLPSFAEGVPMAVLEGMAHGLPVVTTPVGGIPDVIVNGRNGILIPVGDSDAISGAIINLLRDPEERRRLGASAQETVRTLCSLEQVGAMLADTYRDLWRRSGKSSGTSSLTPAKAPLRDCA